MPGADDPTGRPARAAVVIVTYDAPPYLLEQCVDRVLATVDPVTTSVRVVDTGGSATRRLADERYGPVTVLDAGANVGFAGALRIGFRDAAGEQPEAFVSLNDDVLVEPGWLEPLTEALRVDEQLGAVQPVLIQLGSDPEEINSAGVTIDRFGAGSDLLRGRPVADAIAARVAAVTGGAAAWSSRYVDEVGLPDARFFLYYEDVEWCRRGAAGGWEFGVVPESRVLHAGSASTHRLGDSIRRLQDRNRLWSVVMTESPRRIAAGFWLSVRRLRHAPRDVHRAALLDGLRGAPARLAARIRRRPTPTENPGRPAFVSRPLQGVNVLGYHHISSGLGDNARAIARCLRAAGVDVIEIDNDLSSSPRLRPARPMPERLHDTTIAVVTAFEFEGLVARLPQLRGQGRRLVGYWMWELEDVPASHVAAMAVLDEVWTGSAFCRDAYGAAAPGHVPVRHAPYQVPRPRVDAAARDRWREHWGGRFTFLVTFDYLSIPERKNPIAAIRAFTECFPEGSCQLVVKSMNAEHRPEDLAEVEAAVGDRNDVVLLDRHLDEAEHHALIAAADCLVTPHRSEGFGLQPFAALALGTPVISTRYGGVLDYLTDDNAILVEAGRVGVVTGEGIYPVGSPWADVDHGGLVDAMRSIVADAALGDRLIAAGSATAAAWPSDQQLGAGYRWLLTEAEPRTIGFDR